MLRKPRVLPRFAVSSRHALTAMWCLMALALFLLPTALPTSIDLAPSTVYADEEAPAPEEPKEKKAEGEQPAKPQDVIENAAKQLRRGRPIIAGNFALVPIFTTGDPASPLPIDSGRSATGLDFAEPKNKSSTDLILKNTGEKPVFLMGGTVLEGGHRDRLLRDDLLLAPGSEIEIDALPAMLLPRRKEALAAFVFALALAPPYLREKTAFGASSNTVNVFIKKFREFVDGPDADKKSLSLARVGSSPRLKDYCQTCQKGIAEFTPLQHKRVVGFATAINGRVETIEFFGDAALRSANFSALLQSHAYSAAAVALRAEEAGVPFVPALDRAKFRDEVTKEVDEALEQIRTRLKISKKKTPKGTLGQHFSLRAGGARGRLLFHEGRIVHAVLFPHNAFNHALYHKTLELPEEQPTTTDEEVDDPGVLGRRGDRGNLTEYEKRLLDRIRERRARHGIPGQRR